MGQMDGQTVTIITKKPVYVQYIRFFKRIRSANRRSTPRWMHLKGRVYAIQRKINGGTIHATSCRLRQTCIQSFQSDFRPRPDQIRRELIMANDKEANTCKHPTCSCPVEAGASYCSASCEGAKGTLQIDCDCGHPACKGDF